SRQGAREGMPPEFERLLTEDLRKEIQTLPEGAIQESTLSNKLPDIARAWLEGKSTKRIAEDVGSLPSQVGLGLEQIRARWGSWLNCQSRDAERGRHEALTEGHPCS